MWEIIITCRQVVDQRPQAVMGGGEQKPVPNSLEEKPRYHVENLWFIPQSLELFSPQELDYLSSPSFTKKLVFSSQFFLVDSSKGYADRYVFFWHIGVNFVPQLF